MMQKLYDMAWQKTIRDRRAEEDLDADLFGRWWENIDVDIKSSVVREIDIPTARSVILTYEWLGTMPAVVWHCYGIYFDEHLGGVAVYGPEYSENLGVWDKYGFTGKMILLSRGACVHWAHPHSASKLICRSIKLLPKKYEIITATTDFRAGEYGTIYQACNFVCCKMNTHSRSGAVINGKRVNSRALRSIYGAGSKNIILSEGMEVEKEERKNRWFSFRGSQRAKKNNRKSIEHLIIPYPKRAGRQKDEPLQEVRDW